MKNEKLNNNQMKNKNYSTRRNFKKQKKKQKTKKVSTKLKVNPKEIIWGKRKLELIRHSGKRLNSSLKTQI